MYFYTNIYRMLRHILREYPLMEMSRHTGAGLILWNPIRTAVLLVKDDRSNKWSFPKGRIEPYDLSFLHTMIREVQEETRLSYYLDYTIHNHFYTFGKDMHCFFHGTATHTILAPPNHAEHIVDIRYVPISEIHTLDTNRYVNMWLKDI